MGANTSTVKYGSLTVFKTTSREEELPTMSREQLRQLFHTSHDDKHNRRRAFRSAVLRSTQALNAAKKMKTMRQNAKCSALMGDFASGMSKKSNAPMKFF